jgi:hypothetical protein
MNFLLSFFVIISGVYSATNYSTIVIVPDTQFDVASNWGTHTRTAMNWVRECKEMENIQMTLGLGDITLESNEVQWSRAKHAVLPLRFPTISTHVFARGNHDNWTGYGDIFWQDEQGWDSQETPLIENSSSPFGYYVKKNMCVLVLDGFYVHLGVEPALLAWARERWTRALTNCDVAIILDHATRCWYPISGCSLVTEGITIPTNVTALAVGGHERLRPQWAQTHTPLSTDSTLLEVTLNFQWTDPELTKGRSYGGAIGLIRVWPSITPIHVEMRTYSPSLGVFVRTTFSEWIFDNGQVLPLLFPHDAEKCGLNLKHFSNTHTLLAVVAIVLGALIILGFIVYLFIEIIISNSREEVLNKSE